MRMKMRHQMIFIHSGLGIYYIKIYAFALHFNIHIHIRTSLTNNYDLIMFTCFVIFLNFDDWSIDSTNTSYAVFS